MRRHQSSFRTEIPVELTSLIPTYRSTGWPASPKYRNNVYSAVMMRNRTEEQNKTSEHCLETQTRG
ncbi:hypothetical protein M404DRAFT_431552 [Pisolithus tinctorius Marx 270]|uniref:Uncharacterized protein n=1 Tax=Pisolithus tinctorius Marx 270 TaxID=870435 RepID=A0A0C3PGW7_PISTI|nr:hypothetical protein M404DRAFT_431552 [Pisolithus tinctorius Marx 270]